MAITFINGNNVYIDRENDVIDMNTECFKTFTKNYDKYIKDTGVGDVNKFNDKKKVTVILKPLEEIFVDEAYKNLMSLLKDYYNEKVFGLVVKNEDKEYDNVSLYIFGFDFESDSDWSLIHYMYIDKKHIKIK